MNRSGVRRARATEVVFLCAGVSACIDVAERRAHRDGLVGRASAEGISVTVEGGLAAVTSVTAAAINLWAQAPALSFSVEQPGSPAGQQAEAVLITIENVLADATLVSSGGVRVEPVPPDAGTPAPLTVKRWRLINLGGPGAGGVGSGEGGTQVRRSELVLVPPDAGDWAPFRFGVYADIQEKIDEVQDIYMRMNRDPSLRFALLNGDLTTRGTSAQLARFQREMKTLSFPVYATLGNHELGTRDDLFHDFFGRGSFSFEFRGARFTLLDSASATIAPMTYRWLDGWLAAGASSFHVVTMHIPPLDPAGQRGGGFASRIEASMLVSRLAAAHVDLTVYGHVHSFYAFSNAGIPAYITGGGGAVPERLDGIGRHYLAVDVDPRTQTFQVAVVRVD